MKNNIDKLNQLLNKSLQTLDWKRIVEKLASYAGSNQGKERIEGITFKESWEDVLSAQQETTEMKNYLLNDNNIPIGGIRDIRKSLEAAEKGDILLGRDLLDIGNTIRACHQIKRFFILSPEKGPRLANYSAKIEDLQELENTLLNSFDNAGELSTIMYPELRQLRQKIQNLNQRIKDKLVHLLASDNFSDISQDQYVTVRNDRYVVPLKVQAKSMDIGIVHDSSGSGQTVFVEPREVIPLNNELKMSEVELKREERRILQVLSNRVLYVLDRIRKSLEISSEIEFIYSRAMLSIDMQAIEPILVSSPYLKLYSARHPILVLRGLHVVPNDLSIGVDFQALMLSGPNTGGKTVALKTLGLCALMAKTGLHIPAEKGSEVGIFKSVLTDIGDQQTVEHDLSTFSGHIENIRNMLDICGENASSVLLLLDEIAVGTDPTQGEALARAILEKFVASGAKVVCTTHYTALKTLSVQDKRFSNGRVEYDNVALKPTYHLIIGTPGRSYALDIAQKLGIRKDIIKKAQGYLENSQLSMEALLEDLESNQRLIREEKILHERARKDAENLRIRYEQRLEAVEKQALQIREKLVAKFDLEVKTARDELSSMLKQLQQGITHEKGTNKTSLSNIISAKSKVSEIVRRVKDSKVLIPVEISTNTRPLKESELKIGMTVFLSNLKKEATLLTLPDKNQTMVEVQAGMLRMKVFLDELRSANQTNKNQATKIKNNFEPKANQTQYQNNINATNDLQLDLDMESAIQTRKNTLDLRGVRVDEALADTEKFLDELSLENIPYVFIIHGHGTGAMKTAIRGYLKTSPYVRRFQAGGHSQGGDGVSVVELY